MDAFSRSLAVQGEVIIPTELIYPNDNNGNLRLDREEFIMFILLVCRSIHHWTETHGYQDTLVIVVFQKLTNSGVFNGLLT
jgi:hypothetical protein